LGQGFPSPAGDAAARRAAIVLQPYADRALATLPFRQAFAFTLPVEQAHYILGRATGQARQSRQEVLYFLDWIREEAGRESSRPASLA
jgi:hypothetical protein